MPSCLVVQHVEPEGPYAIGQALADAGVAVQLCQTFADDPVPSETRGLDGLVVMGGPMSAYADDGFPSRRAEVALLGEALALGVPVLGVCLGAQLLAIAAGAAVYPGLAGPEIGWAPVSLSAAGRSDDLFGGLPPEVGVLHWHWDTFDLPPGAAHLGSSGRYANQAFRVGAAAWGLQFHLEVDSVAVDAFLQTFGDQAAAVGVVPDGIRAATSRALDGLSAWQGPVVRRFAGMVLGGRDGGFENGVLTPDN